MPRARPQPTVTSVVATLVERLGASEDQDDPV